MIKANELMIGDYVSYCKTDTESTQGRIKKLNVNKYLEGDDEIEIVDNKGCWMTIPNINELQPIPLTAEILEKNGFDGDREVMQYHFEEDGQRYHFSLRQMYDKDYTPHGYSFFAFNVLTILDYVHELQHALRLCGIDKEIKLED